MTTVEPEFCNRDLIDLQKGEKSNFIHLEEGKLEKIELTERDSLLSES